MILPFLGFAQTKRTGKVVDETAQRSLPGVSVVVKGTGNGTVTDDDGNFSIVVADSDTLVFSFIGYQTYKQRVGSTTNFSIALREDATALDEVVVVGYGTSTKKELTGATTKVKGENITKLNIPRMDQALQGQVAGVSINTNSGSPGGSSNIRIRGLSTFGDNDPLILVDGIVYDSEGLNALNPADIESINVLKDATAGIYGVRAANGVILIETKKGKANSKPQFEFSGYYGIQQTSNRLDLLNATEYAVVKNEAFANGNAPLPFANTALGKGTDWQDEVFQTAPIQNYNLTISGGSDRTTYSVGGSYFSQDGIVGGDKANFERYNARVNISSELSKKLTLNSIFLYTHEKRDILPENGIGSVLYNTVNAFPTEPVRQEDGTYSYLEEVSDIINPIAQMENTFNTSMVNKFVGKEELAYKINEHFTFTNRINYNYALVDGKVFSPLVWYGPGKAQNTAANANLDPTIVEIADSVFIERGASVYEARDTYIDFTYEGFVNYEQVFNKDHTVKGTLGASVFRREGEGLNATAYNIPNNSIEFADISANQAPGGFLNNAGSFQFEERLLSAFLRAEYGYKKKYLFSAIVRRDGSSKFGENNRYGFFPTFSGAWIISEEPFYSVKAIDFAKLRASWGVSGNDQIQNFAYRALLNGEGVYVFDDVITQGVAIGRASNPDLKWESTRQFNIGLDLTVLEHFDLSANYFVKNTYDLLFQPDVSGVLGSYGAGGFPPIINAGDVSNTGVELEVGYFTDPSRELRFSANYNVTFLNNKVTRTPEGIEFLPGAQFGVGGNVATRFEEGFPIGYFIGYETDGVFQSQQEIDDAPVTQAGAKPGDFRFVDQNGDGKISFSDDSDQTMIGSPIPEFTMGLNLTFNYKGFDLSTNIYAALGHEIIRNYERQQPYANQLNYVINRWTGTGSTDEFPRLTTGSTRNTVFSDYFVEDGSFVRMRNIQLGYTFPRKWMQYASFSSLRVYVAANNLLTITGYQGYDPDIGSASALSAGVDYGFYPQARTVMVGFNLKF
ncbi:MAG TPA: TonB-dependent receptor [Cryomorphaceae bacterium]|nr:SusC/RagA family TonB-linked outer membrane protein [Owenweeksia sp.]HAD97910.1 TonB-dependent receptor [Cryomorphaceae bacterium]